MTHAVTSKGSSAQQYPKLRQFVKTRIEDNVRGFQLELKNLIRSKYFDLWNQIRVPSLKPKRWNLPVKDLYQILGIDIGCEKCGKEVAIDYCIPLRFCSQKCSANSVTTRESYKKTLLKKTGYESNLLDPSVRNKISEERLLRTGYSNPGQNPEVRRKMRKTCIRKYGYAHHFQNTKVFSKAQSTLYGTKLFVDKHRGVFKCQGYEPFVLKFLCSNPRVENFETSQSGSLPSVEYRDTNGKLRVFYPDIGVRLKSGKRVLIEVKSDYTLLGKPEWRSINKLKFRAAEKYCKKINNAVFILALVGRGGAITWIRNSNEF